MAEANARQAWASRLVLIALTLVYVVVFTHLAFAQHAGMRTHKADLGQIDQAIWNSSRGRLLEFSEGSGQSVRLTDHVEPVFVLISPVFWLWDDVRALLLLQVLFAALGVWPLFALARRYLSPWPALAPVVAYLLAPPLQSALLSEFHAIPLVVPFVLWALWAVEAGHLRAFILATVLVAAVKEEAALLAAGLGLWAVWQARRRPAGSVSRRRWVVAGLAMLLVGMVWFAIATFVIIPPYAARVYGQEQSVYFQRYGALGHSLTDILTAFVTRPGLVWAIITEPARLRYLFGLLAPFGLLSLVGLEVALLGLPLLLANLLSAYPAQYYGEFHYSAPLVPYLAAAAVYGGNRILSRLPHPERRARAATLLGLWVLAWAVGWYALMGRGPGGGRFDPTPITAHHRLLPRFVAQIPAEAAVTATAAVHPHISHRRYAYQFPEGLAGPVPAEFALIDILTNTDMAPGAVRKQVEDMLAGDWGVVDAADGFLLLRRGATDKIIPAAFYSFVRAPADGPLPETALRWQDVAVIDQPRWRQTQVTTRWQVGAAFATTVRPWLELRTPAGELLYTFDALAPPALVWYPPTVWQPGEVITITTVPLMLPREWGVVIGVAHGPNPFAPGDRLPVEQVVTDENLLPSPDGTLALVAAYARQENGTLASLPIGSGRMIPEALLPGPRQTMTAAFVAPDGRPVRVEAAFARHRLWPGGLLDLALTWPDGLPAGYVVFVHLRQAGVNIAQADGPPRFFLPLADAAMAADRRSIPIPSDVPIGATLELVIGLYHAETGARLPVWEATGREIGHELMVGRFRLGRPPVPDQACALLPATCPAQP
jgi:uncharacterized membrane protein